jgi:hypothetical protein
LTLRDLPLSDYTIGIDPIEKMMAKMKEFEGWPIYKIKLGTATTWPSSASCAATPRPSSALMPTPPGPPNKPSPMRRN